MTQGNGTVPTITDEQRMAALERARASRRRRAEALEALATGKDSIREVVERSKADRAISRTRVRAVLLTVPGMGRARAERFMEGCGIPEWRRLGGLGPRQLDGLVCAYECASGATRESPLRNADVEAMEAAFRCGPGGGGTDGK